MVRVWAAGGGLALVAATCTYVALGPAGVAQGQGDEREPIPTLFLTQEPHDAQIPSSDADDDARAVIASRFTVKDRAGATVGGAFETCAKEMAGGRAVTAYCSGIIEIEGKGKIGFQASRAVSGDPTDDHALVTGLVTGGTGAYDGVDGEMDLTPPATADGTWRAEFH
ncbi:hypothetical protein [Streptomyces sp. Je 1-369]|uniref:hypothetical protein n=1 Tax=Streptomyces sp. Je 1-369 TaxID=2966192 RepID=UPI002285887B|nr:hypothetical protein [Streptomyces sp. Je 1-369]WAL95106.1 hypothetical protein NOO62_11725 [Streptomyces sp. Je 1-369]